MSALVPSEKKPAIKTPQELVHIKHRISLMQYKTWVLMLRAYRAAYEERGASLGDEDFCYLPMDKFAEHLGYQPKKSDVEHDMEAIRKEPIIFNVLNKDGSGEKGDEGRRGVGFITSWHVSTNRIGVAFPRIIREAIENLDNRDTIFHLLNWQIFNSFTGKYEAILYKLCKDYIGVGKTPYMTLEKFREYMGIKAEEYTDFKRLSQWVISGPVKRINASEISDIRITVELKREGPRRSVVGLWFLVEPSQQTMMDFGDDPAFRFAKVSIALAQQRTYLDTKGAEEVELSIQRANEYGEEQEGQGREVNYGALYRKAIEEDWGKEYKSKKTRETAKREAEKVARVRQSNAEIEARVREYRSTYQTEQSRLRWTALTEEELAAERKIFIDEVLEGDDTTYNAYIKDFKAVENKARFRAWLGKKYTPEFDPVAYAAWLKAEKGISWTPPKEE
jgi:hypothetical protein